MAVAENGTAGGTEETMTRTTWMASEGIGKPPKAPVTEGIPASGGIAWTGTTASK